MIIQFQNTEADFVEAYAEIVAEHQRQARRRWDARAMLAGLAAGGCLWMVFFARGDDAAQRWFDWVVPLIGIMAVVYAVNSIARLRARQFGRVLGRLVAALTPVAICVGALWWLAHQPHRGAAGAGHEQASLRRTLIPHLPWLYLLVLIGTLGLIQQWTRQRRQWRETPALARAKTAEVVATGVTLTDSVSRSEMQWEGFVRWKETANLFLLFPAAHTAWMLPKRAFASDEERDAMRAMARAIGKPAVAGFPVGAVNPSAMETA